MGSMASKAKQLYELQELDLEIEAERGALRWVEGQLGESQTIIQMRAELSREMGFLGELERGQRSEEWEVEDMRAKVAVLEEKLYGGSVRIPKELEKMHQEVEHLKALQRGKEDIVLDIMAQVEATQSGISARSKELERIEEEWSREQARLSKEREEHRRVLSALEKRRQEFASQVDPRSLELYQALRAQKQGRAIAKVERGMCQGCRITLPMSDLQRARAGEELVQCSSCERILFMD